VRSAVWTEQAQPNLDGRGGVLITFSVLGPVTVYRDGSVVPLEAALLRRLLAALICGSSTAVSATTLIEEIWDGAPPPSARKTLQVYVYRLRQALGEPDRIRHEKEGYWLAVSDAEVDSVRFIGLLGQARAAARRAQLDQASELYRQALALWRGEPYADVAAGPLVAAEIRTLAEHRLQAREESIALELDLGHHTEHLTELAHLVELYPFQERLRACLMLALYRCGRRAEALEVFRTTRALLVDELGVEPDPTLQLLHQAVLNGDPSLDCVSIRDLPRHGQEPEPVQPPAPLITAPAQLPTYTAGFVGRAAQLEQLDELLRRAISEPTTAVTIAAITGSAGMGKTTLALHWAHRAANQFPDGQLYVNLRGFDAHDRPALPAEAIRGFLDAFGISAQQIPTTLAAQTALYRSTLAGRRVLVLLDNASDIEQVRPLLPGSAGSFVVVTSRHDLSGLVTIECARPVILDQLAAAEARDLLACRLGAGRIAAEPTAADHIIDRCAGLPLALSMAAARAVLRPGFALAGLAAELGAGDAPPRPGDAPRPAGDARLDAFVGDGPSTDIRAVFSWSYLKLGPEAARLFRLLPVHPGLEFGVEATAILADRPTRQTAHLLQELASACLAVELRPGRFTVHDLLRTYAAGLANSGDASSERQPALHRVLDYYRHTSARASQLLNPYRHQTVAPPAPGVSDSHPRDVEQALAWFHAEHRALAGAVELAARTGFDTHAWQIAWSVHAFLGQCCHWLELIHIDEIAIDATRRLGDEKAESTVHLGLGVAYTYLGRFDDAHRHYAHIGELLRDSRHDDALLAHGYLNHSVTFARQGRYEHALDHAQLAMDLFRSLGHRPGQAKSLNTIGWYQAQLGRPRQAAANCRRALILSRSVADRVTEALTWDSLGYAQYCLGRHGQAVACYRRSIALLRDLGDHTRIVGVLHHLGDAQLAAGDSEAAIRSWRQAVEFAAHVDHPEMEQIRTKLHQHNGRVVVGR
jgi:DNA-binding SARP family transcriptional activator